MKVWRIIEKCDILSLLLWLRKQSEYYNYRIYNYGILKQEKKIKAIPHKGRVGTEPLGGLYVVLPIKKKKKTYA